MSTFAELAALGNGVGVAYLLEGVAETDFSVLNTNYSYSTVDGRFDQTFAYDARIIDPGTLQRGFGTNGILAASTVTIRLNNLDGGADLLLDSTVVFNLRWRLRCVLYNSSDPSDYAIKILGVFVPLDPPKRDNTTVTLQLADDSFGRAAELAIPPTADEAFANALDAASTEPPVPLAFGGGLIPAIPPAYFDPEATTLNYVLCATTSTAAVDSNEIDELIIRGGGLNYNRTGGEGDFLRVESTMRYNDGTAAPLFTLAKTASLTKDGRTWQVLYLALYVDNLRRWLSDKGYLEKGTVTVPTFGTTYIDIPLDRFNTQVLPTLQFEALGPVWSSRTYSGSLDAFGSHTVTIHAPDIVYDLLRYYSRGLSSSQVNQASFTAATAAFPLYFFKARYYFTNFVQGVSANRRGGGLGAARDATSALKGVLNRAVSELCQGGLFDVVTNWSGEFTAHVLANSFSLQTATPTEVDETLIASPNDRVPGQGERWAPYNRVIFQSNGRILDNAGAISDWGQVLTRTINDSAVDIFEAFSGTDFGIGTFGSLGVLESVVRPLFSFEYPLDALNWELGDFISVTWSRGASGHVVYSGAVFRIESINVNLAAARAQVTAVWIDDLATSDPYLLDDETYLVRSKGATSGTVTLEDGNPIALAGGTIDYVAMGVEAGDILVVLDSSEAADSFKRNACFRVTSVDAVDEIQITPDADFGAPTPVAVADADWYIVRGATTYHTAVSDPTNYPYGGDMYGKQSENGLFSDSSNANRLSNAG